MPRRDTKRFKAGSFAISFGALMLPLVYLIAAGLLLVTVKMFILSGFQGKSQPIPAAAFPAVPRVKPETPRSGTEGTPSPPSRQPVERSQPPAQRAATVTNAGNRNEVPQSGDAAKKEKVVVVVPTPPAPRPQTQNNPKPAAPQAPRPAQARPTQVRPSTWMVQVGAYSTKASADSVVKTLAQSGHTASVLPGNRLHRVLVQAGTTRQEASNLASRLEKTGFPGAFVVSPTS